MPDSAFLLSFVSQDISFRSAEWLSCCIYIIIGNFSWSWNIYQVASRWLSMNVAEHWEDCMVLMVLVPLIPSRWHPS